MDELDEAGQDAIAAAYARAREHVRWAMEHPWVRDAAVYAPCGTPGFTRTYLHIELAGHRPAHLDTRSGLPGLLVADALTHIGNEVAAPHWRLVSGGHTHYFLEWFAGATVWLPYPAMAHHTDVFWTLLAAGPHSIRLDDGRVNAGATLLCGRALWASEWALYYDALSGRWATDAATDGSPLATRPVRTPWGASWGVPRPTT